MTGTPVSPGYRGPDISFGGRAGEALVAAAGRVGHFLENDGFFTFTQFRHGPLKYAPPRRFDDAAASSGVT